MLFTLYFEMQQTKSPEFLRGLNMLSLNYSNDITEPRQSLYATTKIYLL